MHWEDYCDIADALNEAYPDKSLKDLKKEELVRLVKTLPDLMMRKSRPKWFWMRFGIAGSMSLILKINNFY